MVTVKVSVTVGEAGSKWVAVTVTVTVTVTVAVSWEAGHYLCAIGRK